MGAVKEDALVLASQGDLGAYAALKALPEQERGVLTAIASSNKELAVEILALLAGSGTGKDGRSPLPFRGAVYAAARQLRTGERLGREFYWNEYTGPMDSLIGIRDLTTRNIGPSSWEGPFPLTEDEAKARGLELTGDHSDMAGKVFITVDADRRAAVATYTQELAAYKATLEALKARADLLGEKVDPAAVPSMPQLQYKPIIGIGIIWGEELYANVYKNPSAKKEGKNPKEKWGARVELDLKNFSWQDRLVYRCLRSGYKMIPGALRGAEPSGEDVDFDLGGQPVGREQWLAAQEKEKARVQAAAALAGAPDKADKVAAMRAGAYGPQPSAEQSSGESSATTGDSAPDPAAASGPVSGEVLPAIDVTAVLARLHAAIDAAEKQERGSVAPNPIQTAKVWDALRATGLPDEALDAVVVALVGAPEFTTYGQAFTVFTWLKPVKAGDAVTLYATALAEAQAIAAWQLAQPVAAGAEVSFDE